MSSKKNNKALEMLPLSMPHDLCPLCCGNVNCKSRSSGRRTDSAVFTTLRVLSVFVFSFKLATDSRGCCLSTTATCKIGENWKTLETDRAFAISSVNNAGAERGQQYEGCGNGNGSQTSCQSRSSIGYPRAVN